MPILMFAVLRRQCYYSFREAVACGTINTRLERRFASKGGTCFLFCGTRRHLTPCWPRKAGQSSFTRNLEVVAKFILFILTTSFEWQPVSKKSCIYMGLLFPYHPTTADITQSVKRTQPPSLPSDQTTATATSTSNSSFYL